MEETTMYKKTLTATLAAFAAVALAACGGGGDAPDAGGSSAGAGSTPAPAAGAIDPSSIADPGTINGTITFAGAPPEAQVLQMAADPFCVTAHAGMETLSQRLVVNDNGTLRYVFVYVKGGLEGQTFTGAGNAIRLTQSGCMYDPHMVGLQVNQTLTIVNDDDTLHNVNAQPTAAGNQGFNFAQPVKGMTNDQSFASQEVMIPLKCDVHPWMQAYVGVMAHPYFAVTAEDGGFTISNLAAGDYVIGAWHESLGEQEQNVTVSANGTVEISFDFGS
jgi:hypothetical protein